MTMSRLEAFAARIGRHNEDLVKVRQGSLHILYEDRLEEMERRGLENSSHFAAYAV